MQIFRDICDGKRNRFFVEKCGKTCYNKNVDSLQKNAVFLGIQKML